jgi:hypothetical protein
MTIQVKNRSEESWGPLAKWDDKTFNSVLNTRRESTKGLIKEHIKKQKKLKTYKVKFIKQLVSDSFEIKAESDYDVSSKAREFFKDNAELVGFKETPRGRYAGDYAGYDTISYVKAR